MGKKLQILCLFLVLCLVNCYGSPIEKAKMADDEAIDLLAELLMRAVKNKKSLEDSCPDVGSDVRTHLTNDDLGTEYIEVTGDYTWEEARQSCINRGYYLAQMSSDEEITYINGVINSDSDWAKKTWIDGTDQGHEGCWMWTYPGVRKASFVGWGPGQPNNGGNEDQHCAALNYYYDNMMADNPCSQKYNILCEREIGNCVDPSTVLPSQSEYENEDLCNCADVGADVAVHLYNSDLGNEYISVSGEYTWEEARQSCINRGYYLAQMSSDEEFTYINGVLNNDPDWAKKTWIDGTDQGHEECWVWTYPEVKNATYVAWGPGQPNNGGSGDQHCASLNYYYDNMMADNPCYQKYNILCEREIAICVDPSTVLPTQSEYEDTFVCNCADVGSGIVANLTNTDLGNEYIVVRGNYTWEEARQSCINRGYYLAQIDSEEEFTYIRGVLDNSDAVLECKLTQQGREYMGTVNTTNEGLTCQAWAWQSPHEHNRNNIANFPDATLEDAANYCRNPDNEPAGPWCYTTDPNTRWQYCDVPFCPSLEDKAPYTWVDGTDQGHEGCWVWTYPQVMIVDFEGGLAATQPTEHCAIINGDVNYEMSDSACGNKLDFLCERTIDKCVDPTVVLPDYESSDACLN